MEDQPPVTPPAEVPIPQEAIDRWGTLPTDRFLALLLTKPDLDNFFLGIRGLARAHSYLEVALANLHKGDEAGVANAFVSSHEAMILSFNQINAFIAAAMMTATPHQEPGHE